MGNTPIHVAAKSGSLETLQFLCKAATRSFLNMQNDFGFTPLEAAQEKSYLMEESWSNKMASCKNREERMVLVEQEAVVKEKIQRIMNGNFDPDASKEPEEPKGLVKALLEYLENLPDPATSSNNEEE